MTAEFTPTVICFIPHICHFSPQAQFVVKFVSMQKSVNRDKTDFIDKVA